MRILVGVDGSAASFNAIRMAGKLLDPVADSVALYYSPLELEKRVPGGSHAIVDGAAAALFAEARQLLPTEAAARAELLQSDKPPAVGLLDSAADWQADLIVVGARGHGSLQQLLLGSVSRAVVHGAHLPVLVVRAAPPADRGLRVLVCHHKASAASVAKAVGHLHWPAGTAGSVLGVAESMLVAPLPPWLANRVRDPDVADVAKAWQHEHDVEVKSLEAALRGFGRELPPAFRDADPIVLEGNPGDRILERAKAEGIDLVVLGRTPTDALSRWLIGSTSEAVLTHAHASVLIVPVEKR